MFGGIKNRKVFLSAMNAEQRQNFKWFETVLSRAASGRAAGSPTAPFQEVLKQLRGVPGAIRDLIFDVKGTLKGAGEASLFDRRIASLSKIMFDPQWRPQIAALLELDSSTPAAARAFTQLIDEVVSSEESN